MIPDQHTEIAEEAGRGDERSFGEVIEEIKSLPVTTDDEKRIRDSLCYNLGLARVHIPTRWEETIAENLKFMLDEKREEISPAPTTTTQNCLNAFPKLIEILTPLTAEERKRVVKASLIVLGDIAEVLKS